MDWAAIVESPPAVIPVTIPPLVGPPPSAGSLFDPVVV